MAGDSVPLEFGPGFAPIPLGCEYATDPIDVSEYVRATLVCRGGVVAARAGRGLSLTVQESSDKATWAEPLVPRIRHFSDGAFEEATFLDLDRPWLRVKVVFNASAPGLAALRPAFRAELRLEKREP